MLTNSKMCARCAVRINVKANPATGDFVTEEACPAGIPAGTSTGVLVKEHCGECPIAEAKMAELAKSATQAPPVVAPVPGPDTVVVPAPTDVAAPATIAAAPPEEAPAAPPMPVLSEFLAPPPQGMPEAAPLPSEMPAAVEVPNPDHTNAVPAEVVQAEAARVLAEVAQCHAPGEAPVPAMLTTTAPSPDTVPITTTTTTTTTVVPPAPAPAVEPVSPAPAGMPEAVELPAAAMPVVKREFTSSRPIKIDGIPELDDEAYVDVDAILAAIPGCLGGPSVGGLSSHMMADFASCPRKFYYATILGLQPEKPNRNFQYGSLYHACMAMRYALGAEHTYIPCDAVAAAGAPKLAGEVRNLVMSQIGIYQDEEWKTWSVRAVENVIACWLPLKIGKKTVKVPVVGRVDITVAKKGLEEAHPGPGPVPGGVFLGDWKTSSYVTYDLITGYGMDFQFLVYNAIFQEGGLEAQFGPLRGTMVTIARKGQKVPKADDFTRVDVPYSKATLNEFIESELKPLAGTLYGALMDESVRTNEAAWCRNHTQCIGRWGQCDFFKLCDGKTVETAAGFVVNEGRRIDVSTFLEPPKTGTAKAEPADVLIAKEAKKKEDAHNKEAVLQLLVTSFLATLETSGTLNRTTYLTPGSTYEIVSKQLCKDLQAAYATAVADKTVFELEGYTFKFLKSSITWAKEGPGKGRITWKQLAEGICKLDWYDPAKAMPPVGA